MIRLPVSLRVRRCPGPCGLRISAGPACCPACFRLLPAELRALWVGSSLLRHRSRRRVRVARRAVRAWFAANPVRLPPPVALVGGRHRPKTETTKETS